MIRDHELALARAAARELEAELEGKYEAAPNALYEIVGSDGRRRVRNTTVAPYRYICNLEFVDSQGRGFAFGTGTLVGPRTVLTAAHNLFLKGGRLIPAESLRVIPARSGDTEPFGSSPATRLIPNPLYVPTDEPTQETAMSLQDYGIIRLRSRLGDTVGYWGQKPNPAFDPRGTSISAAALPRRLGVLSVNLSGYPGDKPNDPALHCRRAGAPRNSCAINTDRDTRSRLCGAEQWRSYEPTVALNTGLLSYLNDTCAGHSGSPVWVKRSRWMGGRVLVGVNVVGDGSSNEAVRITPSIIDFINANQ